MIAALPFLHWTHETAWWLKPGCFLHLYPPTKVGGYYWSVPPRPRYCFYVLLEDQLWHSSPSDIYVSVILSRLYSLDGMVAKANLFFAFIPPTKVGGLLPWSIVTPAFRRGLDGIADWALAPCRHAQCPPRHTTFYYQISKVYSSQLQGKNSR